MTDQASLLHAILANPDDQALRRVYADWLEDHGDPRAGVVRLQCELATTAEDDPRRAELEVREGEMLEEHGEECFGPLMRMINEEFSLRAAGIAWLLFLHAGLPIPGANILRASTIWRGEVEQDGRIFPSVLRVLRREGNVIGGNMRCQFEVARFGLFTFEGVVVGRHLAYVTDRRSGLVSHPGLYIGQIEKQTIHGWWQVPSFSQEGEFSFSRR